MFKYYKEKRIQSKSFLILQRKINDEFHDENVLWVKDFEASKWYTIEETGQNKLCCGGSEASCSLVADDA